MTTPDVPHRFEISVEVPGTRAQVWDAIATSNGISSWMMQTEIEEREGGTVVFHMGPGSESVGKVTAWDPPNRIVYEEYWGTLAGQDESLVTPLVTEFVVEAQSGGTCVVRVVSSAFGTGAEWESEFFDGMGSGWTPMFDILRLYLTHFPGQVGTFMEVNVPVGGTAAEAAVALRRSAGIESVGQAVELAGASGVVERIGEEDTLVRLTAPVEGLVAIFCHAWSGEPQAFANARLFGDGAPVYAEQARPTWESWLQSATAAVSAQ